MILFVGDAGGERGAIVACGGNDNGCCRLIDRGEIGGRELRRSGCLAISILAGC